MPVKEPAPRSIRDMYNRITRYEVVAVIPTGTFRIGFTSKPSKRALIILAQDHVDDLLPYADDSPEKYSRASGLRLGANLQIKLSGRTERDVLAAEKRPKT